MRRQKSFNLTTDLDWYGRINQLLLSVSQRAGLLRWMSKDIRPSTVQQLYVYFLRPKLEYACLVWDGALLERDAIALERVQGAGLGLSLVLLSTLLRRSCLNS